MKLKRFIAAFFTIIVLCTITALSTSANDMVADKATKDYLSYTSVDENSVTVIYPQTISDGTDYLFLPSSADLSSLSLNLNGDYDSITVKADKFITLKNGEAFDLLSLYNDSSAQDGKYTVTITAVPKIGIVFMQELTIMKSENIRALYLTSDDPVSNGREWVDSVKGNKAEGNMAIVSNNGEIDYEDKLTEVKARGNSTFTDFEKKAYQIKIKNKTNLIGDDNNKHKTWVLLANAADVTLLHNSLVYSLAYDLGLPFTVEYEPIDLYYDGEYRGSYLLSEKVQVDDGRVEIQNLDDTIEELNEDTDAYENPSVVTKTRESGGETDAKENSAGSLKYVENLIEPTLEEGTNHFGYLLELEFIYRYPDEQSGFVTDRGQAVVTKNPEYLTKETGLYISNFFQEFEDAVFSPDGYNAETGKYYYEYCDLDSLVTIYLINEFTKNYDSFRSSAFFYLPEDEDIMYAGPLWDYDISLGTGYDGSNQYSGNPENLWAATKYMLSTLITIESFRDAVKEKLDSENGEFYLAVQNMLGEDGNIAAFASNIYASQKMNYTLWEMGNEETSAFLCSDEKTYENAVKYLYRFASERIEWLSELTSDWNGDTYSAPKDPTKWTACYRYHITQVIAAKNATCTEDGNTKGVVCTDCGKVFTQSKKIEAAGHKWNEATCKTPATCTVCGETSGDCGEHSWSPATCKAPATCTVCGETSGDCGEHSWSPATCKTPATCTVCGETSENYGEHSWSYATCFVPETCTVCGATRGDVADHDYVHNLIDARNSEFCTVYNCSFCNKLKLVYNIESGDINKDGTVNAADARLALRIAAGLEKKSDEIIRIADLNNDGNLTAADARLILRKAAGLK